jgi:hypothetical protein
VEFPVSGYHWKFEGLLGPGGNNSGSYLEGFFILKIRVNMELTQPSHGLGEGIHVPLSSISVPQGKG